MSKIIHNKNVFSAMEEWAPLSLAYDWDNVGLQVGSSHLPVKKVMVTLDVLESVVDEAITKNVDLIIAHHPMLFKSLKMIDYDEPKGRLIKKIIENKMTVYASHTNLDIAEGGVNDLLADRLALVNKANLIDIQEEQLYKLAVYVPETHADQLRLTLGKVGAGHLGNYSHTTFNIKGEGMFKPEDNAEPFTGEAGQIEVVPEIKIETIIKENDKQSVLEAVKQVHPYEEIAYDLYALENAGKKQGIGRIGELQEAMPLKDFTEFVKGAFGLETVRVIGDLHQEVYRVAILGGSGENFIAQAKQANADVYITGDVTFHNAQDAMEMGLAVIDAGHYIEEIMKKATKDYLTKKFGEGLSVITSQVNTDPFQVI